MTRLLGLLILLDGALSAVYGHAFIRWLRARTPPRMHFLLTPFELVPQPLFRAGALLQAATGAHLLVRGHVFFGTPERTTALVARP